MTFFNTPDQRIFRVIFFHIFINSTRITTELFSIKAFKHNSFLFDGQLTRQLKGCFKGSCYKTISNFFDFPKLLFEFLPLAFHVVLSTCLHGVIINSNTKSLSFFLSVHFITNWYVVSFMNLNKPFEFV